jgi:NAD(P)-dependent dehydrogenase (short-subunit alcohol dehydrogenase family)
MNEHTDQLRFDGKVAIVTGAGRGLGRAHARLLAARGAAVVANDVGGSIQGYGSSVAPAENVVAEITAAGGTAVASDADVADDDGAGELVARAIDAFGRLDVVVNNAGIVEFRPFGELTRADLDRMLAVHVGGSWSVTHAAWCHLAAAGAGRVVMTTSAAGVYGIPNGAHYSAAKAAILGLTRALAIEGAPAGIKVNAVAPLAYTRMAAASQFPEVRERLARIAAPEQVSALVALLVHDSFELSGTVFQAGAGEFAEVFAGQTAGVHQEDPSPEKLAASLGDIRGRTGWIENQPSATAPAQTARALDTRR